MLLVGGLVSVSPPEARLVDSVGGVLDPSDSLNPFSHPSTRLPELQLMFGYGSLHFFLSFAG